MPLPDSAAWSDLLRQALGRYDEALSDLKHAKGLPNGATMSNQTLLPSKNFDHTNLLTVPRSFQFGMRLTF